MIFNNLISKLSTNLLLAVIGVLIGVVFALGIYSYFTSNSLNSTREDLTKKDIELKDTKEAFNTAVKEYENQLVFERDKNTFQETTLREKEQVIKSSEKVKLELQKRKETKQDEKNCPKLGTFKL
jgi:cell division protein FtsB